MPPSSPFRFKAKIKNDKQKLLSSHHNHQRHQGFSQIYLNIMKRMEYSFFFFLCRAVYWEHKVQYTGSLHFALRSFKTWDAIWRRKTSKWREDEIWTGQIRVQVWHLNMIVTQMDYKAKYSFPRSDVVFLLPLVHDKKSS